jgi:feruloyl esterase
VLQSHSNWPTQEFFRYFLVPGRCHGEEGGPGFSRLSGNIEGESILSTLVEWVEQGKVPNQLIATAYRDGCTSNEIIAQRPVYPYPKFAKYIGGDPNTPSNYKGIEHQRGNVLKPDDRYLC